MSDTTIKIIDLDEIINKDSKPIKIGKYKGDLNEIPLSSYIEINKLTKNAELCTEDVMLETVIYPFLEKHNKGLKYDDEFVKSLTVKQITTLWNELIKALWNVDISGDDKKKEV